MAEAEFTSLLANRVERIEEDIKRNSITHREFFSKFEEQGKAQAVTDVHYVAIMGTLATITATLDVIQSSGGRKWNMMIATIISAFTGGIVAMVLTAMG